MKRLTAFSSAENGRISQLAPNESRGDKQEEVWRLRGSNEHSGGIDQPGMCPSPLGSFSKNSKQLSADRHCCRRTTSVTVGGNRLKV